MDKNNSKNWENTRDAAEEKQGDNNKNENFNAFWNKIINLRKFT